MSRVSICIPTYNNLEQVIHLLQSIEEQTYQDIEIIITDDSTNPAIEEWIGAHREDESFTCLKKCTYQHNKKPLGHIFNWNEALSKATGEYIKIMFSDDWFTYKDSLERMVKALEEKPEAALVFTGSMQVSPRESYSRCASDEFIERFRKDYRYLFIDYQIGAPSASLYRACDCYFDERSTFASDVFLFMRILKKNSHFVCIKEPLISIGIHDNQYTCGFDEKDERKLTDYQILFTEYGMVEKKEYRKEFLKSFIFPYGKGWSYAKSMKIPFGEYAAQYFEILWWKLTVGYPHGIKKRLKALRSR